MKRILHLFLLTTVVAAGLSGCRQGLDSPKEKTIGESLVITAGKQADENYGRYESGEDVNHNPMIQLGEEQLGIKIQYTILGTDYDDYVNRLQLALTDPDSLPDVISVYDQALLGQMIDSGEVKAIDDDLEKYLPPRLKKIYETFPETFAPVKKDGKTYGLAIAPVLGETEVMVIRQDWLDRLGLAAPTNLAEFENVIRAFSEEDPDGNGIKDTYGFTYSGDGLYSTGWVADPAMLFSAHTGKFIPGNWEEDGTGQLRYGSVDPGNKETLTKMAEWHKAGWLAPNAALASDWTAMLAFSNGEAGIFVGRPSIMAHSIGILNADGADRVKAYPTIRQANGEPTYQRAEENDGWFLFDRNFDRMDRFFEYYDWLYDAAFGTGAFRYGYLENYDYDIVDGQVVFEKAAYVPPKNDWMFDPGKAGISKNQPQIDTMRPAYDVYHGKPPETGQELRIAAEYQSVRKEQVIAGALAYDHRQELVVNKFRGQLSDELQSKFEQLQDLEATIYTDIIYGNKTPAAFDDFVTAWEKEGGQAITAAVNEWYQQLAAEQLIPWGGDAAVEK